MNPARLVASGVSRMWTPSSGLRPLDLTVVAGEFVGLRGRSGSGKSTLLAILGGWCRPDTGTVTLAGRVPDERTAWEDIAIVPQTLGLAAELTVAETVTDALASDVRGGAWWPWLERLDLDGFARRPTTDLSSGQRQRVAVARAVAASPRLLLADEPTSFQGAEHTTRTIDALAAVAAAGSMVLVATHDPIVLDAVDRVVDLDASR